jgi:benzoyl-CoA reductase/2-hydroxyglutaryl-CoA dehydratase subunit BcrC/BadD/HgdB
MPHGTDDSSLKFFATLLETFRKSLGKMAGKEITDEAISKAIVLHNEYRRKIRDLYELRRTERPLISASDVTKVLVAGMSLPVEEAIDLVSNVITEAIQSSPRPLKKRLMVVGAEIDSASFMELVESSGADVVNDDLCPGMREYIGEVRQGSNPLEALAHHYLLDIKCARTFRDPKGDYQNSLEERFGHIRHRIKDFNVEGVIIYIYKYCDPFGFEVPAMKSYIEALGIPVLHLEDDYSSASYERLRTRIQAFIEMIGQ